jgi:uncharacterized protein YdaT
MPWTRDRFPLAMQRLLPAVRIKAIETAFAREQWCADA